MLPSVNFSTIFGFLLSILLFVACTKSSQADGPKNNITKKEKWLTYNERMSQLEKAQRKKGKVRFIDILTPENSDSGLVMMKTGRREYDIEGNLLEDINYDISGNQEKILINSYRDGILRKASLQSKRGISYNGSYAYDKDGNKLRELLLSPAGDTIVRRDYVYDGSGRETEALFFRKETGQNLRKTTEYDKEGRPHTVIEYDDSKVNWTERYRYEKDKWITTRSNGEGKLMAKYVMNFNSNGLCTQLENIGPEEKLRLRISYTYDKNKNLILEIYTGAQGQQHQRFEYEHNEKELVTSQTIVSPQQPGGIRSERRYSYYGE